MKAVRVHGYGGTEQMRLELVERPKPLAGQVLIRVLAAGVLPVDWKIRQGWFMDVKPGIFPYIPGSAIAGIVEEAGPGSDRFNAGEAVFGRSDGGAYAEYVATSAEMLAHMPAGLDFAAAATISGGAATAWQAIIREGDIFPGARVLIHGAAGGVGAYAVQFAKWKRAYVYATAGARNLDFVRALGADEVIDYTSVPFEKVAFDLDLALDTVGGETLERTWAAVRRGGTLISLLEKPSEAKAAELGIRALKPDRLSGFRELEQIARLIAKRVIQPVAGRKFSLEDVRLAHKMSETGRGRIVLEIRNSPE